MAEKYAAGPVDAKWQRRWAEARVAYVDTAVPGNEFYDFDDKYLDGTAQLRIPAPLSDESQKEGLVF